ncbi:ATP-NAD kinase family protein [Agromyces sp. NPDC055520]
MLGLIVNPVAGIGGPAGLAGSDGRAVQARAAARGAESRAAERARSALAVVAAAHPGTRVLTAAGSMGEHVVRAAGLEPIVVGRHGEPTDAADTTAAARALAEAGATLVLFAGGDGTARDVAAGLRTAGRGGDVGTSGRLTAAGADAPGVSPRSSCIDDGDRPVAALGIPAGVKMYSPVFAVSPRVAGTLAAAWLSDDGLPVRGLDVLDVDEEALRHARVEPRLYGTLDVPYRSGRTQARKTATPADEQASVRGAASAAAAALRPGVRYLLGPGSTMAELARELGVPKTPVGVDVVLDGRRVLADASESQLLDEIAAGPSKAVVTVIGGQGFLLGRGNQQLSARVLRALGDDPLIVVAPEQKLIDLAGRPLLIDTGDAAVDARLEGFVRVITGAAATSIYPVTAPDAEGSSPEASEPEGEGHAP